MLISVQTGGTLDQFGIDKGMKMISEAGFDGVDINLDQLLPGAQIKANKLNGFFDQSDSEILEAVYPYKAAAEKYGLSFLQAHAPFPNCLPHAATNAYVLEAVKKTIMICNYLGCKNLVVHPGFLPANDRMPPEDEWEYNMHMYVELIPYLRQYGVVCCLENLFFGYRGKMMEGACADPHEAIRYLDALNEIAGERLFGFCLDTGHAVLLSKDLYAQIHMLGDRIQVMHVHDNNGLTDEHLLPYMGIIDWDRFCRALKEINYAHNLSFETFRAVEIFDGELAPQVLQLIHATGEMFKKRIQV